MDQKLINEKKIQKASHPSKGTITTAAIRVHRHRKPPWVQHTADVVISQSNDFKFINYNSVTYFYDKLDLWDITFMDTILHAVVCHGNASKFVKKLGAKLKLTFLRPRPAPN